MSEEQQIQQEKKYPAPLSAKFAGGALVTAVPILAHFGPTGLLLSGVASLIAYRHGPEMYEMARDTLPFLPSLEGRGEPRARTSVERTMWDRLTSYYPEEGESQEGEREAPTNEADFVTEDRSTEVPGVPRYTVEEIVSHIPYNSYKVYIGRSLTKPSNPALSMNFFRRHLKVIGASQKGKSSMAAALLSIMLRTHDSAHVLVALLDKENRTGRLFENDPHIVRVRVDGREVPLHARNSEQVCEQLELLVQILEYRASMPVQELRKQPLIVIYLEEFLMLKKELKARAAKYKDARAKEQATTDYERFVYCVNAIAGLGLKLNMQFLICAQVDYRDDDLYEAFANITAGFCFCVKATAAASAGFLQTELLNQNAKNNKAGQCVAETPDGHDLILAPDFDLEQRLLDMEASEHVIYRNQARVNGEIPIYRGGNGAVNGATSGASRGTGDDHLRLPEMAVNGQSEEVSAVNVNEDIRETIKRLVEIGKLTHAEIAKIVKLDGRKYPMYRAVCQEMGISTEREG